MREENVQIYVQDFSDTLNFGTMWREGENTVKTSISWTYEKKYYSSKKRRLTIHNKAKSIIRNNDRFLRGIRMDVTRSLTKVLPYSCSLGKLRLHEDRLHADLEPVTCITTV